MQVQLNNSRQTLATELTTKKIRVYVADEQHVVRRGICLLLCQWPDIEVVGESGDGYEAVEDIGRLCPDVVIVDFSNPDLSGLACRKFVKLVSENTPSTAVIVLTSCDRERFLSETLEAGIQGFVLKKDELEDLVRAARIAASGGTYICPSMQGTLIGDYVRRGQVERNEDSYRLLTRREREVFPMLANANTNIEIAKTLFLSPSTVQTYRQRIMKKLELHNGMEIVRYAIKKGIVSLED